MATAACASPVVVVDGGGYFPVLVRLQNGTLLSVLRGGAPHIGKNGRLDLVASADAGKSWPQRWNAVDGPDDDRNPAFGQLKDGTVVLAYSILSGYDTAGLKLGSRHERKFDGVFVVRSKDNGKTWTKPEKNEATAQLLKSPGALSPYGKIVQLPDGAALMAVYYEIYDSDGATHFESWLFRSVDSGKTWTDPSLIRKDGNETAIAVMPDGSLLAAVRTGKAGYLTVMRSSNHGRTWNTPMPVTKDAEHPADLIVLQDGRVLMTFGERNAPRGIHALLSGDGGKTWGPANHIVLAGDAPNTDCGYPSSWEIAPGRIVTIYYQVDDLRNVPASAKAKALLWTLPSK